MTRKKYNEILNEFTEICESNLCNSCELTKREVDDRRYCLLKYAYNKGKEEYEKSLKEIIDKAFNAGYRKGKSDAIDKFIEKCDKHFKFNKHIHPRNAYVINRESLLIIAEQLKELGDE